jgi:hypothetical protein
MFKPPTLPKPSAAWVRPGSAAHFSRYSTAVLALASTAGAQAAIVYSNPTDATLTQGQTTRVDFLTGSFVGSSGLNVSYSGSEYVEFFQGTHVSATATDGGQWGKLSRFSDGASIGSGGGAVGWDVNFNYADY